MHRFGIAFEKQKHRQTNLTVFLLMQSIHFLHLSDWNK